MFLKQLSAALLVACVATAAGAVEVPVKKGAKAAAEARADDLVCTYERATGSHLKKRVCATRAQREARAAADQDIMRGAKLKDGAGGTNRR
jgi:hypothetical protein